MSSKNEMTGAEMVIQALKDQGVKHIFGYPAVPFCRFMMK